MQIQREKRESDIRKDERQQVVASNATQERIRRLKTETKERLRKYKEVTEQKQQEEELEKEAKLKHLAQLRGRQVPVAQIVSSRVESDQSSYTRKPNSGPGSRPASEGGYGHEVESEVSSRNNPSSSQSGRSHGAGMPPRSNSGRKAISAIPPLPAETRGAYGYDEFDDVAYGDDGDDEDMRGGGYGGRSISKPYSSRRDEDYPVMKADPVPKQQQQQEQQCESLEDTISSLARFPVHFVKQDDGISCASSLTNDMYSTYTGSTRGGGEPPQGSTKAPSAGNSKIKVPVWRKLAPIPLSRPYVPVNKKE